MVAVFLFSLKRFQLLAIFQKEWHLGMREGEGESSWKAAILHVHWGLSCLQQTSFLPVSSHTPFQSAPRLTSGFDNARDSALDPSGGAGLLGVHRD